MIGKTLAHYEILAPLGSGGMAEIYRARDTKLGREVALKVLPPEWGKDDERRKRFHREAKALAALKHPHIVTLYTAEEEGETLFLTMELVDGKTLRNLVPEKGLPLRKILDISIPLVDAVGYAHKQGITHRDLKPMNIMVDEEGRTKVLDFGLVKLLEPESPSGAGMLTTDANVTGEGRVIGTAAYIVQGRQFGLHHQRDPPGHPFPGERSQPGPPASPGTDRDSLSGQGAGTPLPDRGRPSQ
jgi:serine/threonine protein kinase